MNRIRLAAWAIAMAALNGAAMAVSDDHTPQHGGVVVETKDMDFELVAKQGLITLYLREHGKVIDAKGATGKVTVLNGAQKTEAPLAHVSGNKIEARGAFEATNGTKIVATVQLSGKKPVNVRFALN
jgi:hypothetical protein